MSRLMERVPAGSYLWMGDNPNLIKKLIKPNTDEHQERYRFAGYLAQSLPRLNTIIDAASGSGWGTHYLARKTSSTKLIGIDIDPQAITEARRFFNHYKVGYMNADLLKPEQINMDKTADLFVCFETLEHFLPEQAETLLRNINMMTSKNGSLAVSSPNRPLFSPYSTIEGKSWYPFHPKEYTPDELISVLEKTGWRVEGLYGQRFVDKDEYLKIARALYFIRKFAHVKHLSPDHLLSRLPFALLQRYTALKSDAEVHKMEKEEKLSPIYLTAVCSHG